MPTVTFVGGPLHGEAMEMRDVYDLYEVPLPEPVVHWMLERWPAAFPSPSVGRYHLRLSSCGNLRYVYAGPREPRPRLLGSCAPSNPAATSPDSHTMRFADMSAEAEAELAAWRALGVGGSEDRG